MCKTPAAECKPVIEDDNIQAEDDNAPQNSEDESEFTDTDESYLSESSADNGERSDTDAESASGNRVTPEMVVWLMLKERGLISEEMYIKRPECCTDNIKSLIPTIPRSYSWDSVHTRSGSDINDDSERDSDDDNLDELDVKVEDNSNGNTVDTSNKSEVDGQRNIETVAAVEPAEKEAGVKDNAKNDTIISEKDASKDRSHEDLVEIRKQQADTDIRDKLQEDIEKLQKQQALLITQEETNKQMMERDKQVRNKQHDFNKGNQQKGTMHEQETSNQNVCNPEQQHEVISDVMLSENSLATVNKYSNKPDIVLEDVNNSLAVIKAVQEDSQILSENISQSSKLTTKNISNTLNKNDSEAKINAVVFENVVEEYNNNEDIDKIKKDAEFMDTTDSKEEAQCMELKSRDKSNEITGKQTKSFRYILKKLAREKRIAEEKHKPESDEYGPGFVEDLKTYVRSLDDDYDDNKAVDLFDDPTDELQSFALLLNFYSPSSYKYVTENFSTPLPEHKVLCSWYLKEDEEPGLSAKAFNILKQKSASKRLTCALMFCDIYLRNEGDRWYDQVDYGGGPSYDHIDKAVLVYVFILVSLDEDWKMPIGYIFARYISAETEAELIRVCLTQCHDAGADVVAVTLEKPTPAEFLGCSFQDPKNLKTTFKHPVCERDVAVWIDPCLALKSARHTLKVKGELQDYKGHIIRWNLLRRLRRLHSNTTFSFDTPELLILRKHVAKIGLTTETFSRSLATAIALAEDFVPQSFRDTAPTQKYILYINYIYDVLNGTARGDISHLNRAKKYLLSLYRNRENGLSLYDDDNLDWGDKRNGYRFLMEGKSACGFIGFLICIESYKHLHATLIEKEKRLKHLDTLRLCKVHAEDFVNNIRADTYVDPDNFTGGCFQRFYRNLFVILEKNPHFSDREISMEHWRLNDRYPPAVTIKLTSGKRAYDDGYSSQYALKRLRKTSRKDRATYLVREYSKALDTEMDVSVRKSMVGYLAGWIAARFGRYLRCEACIDALCTHRRLWFHNYITSKRLNRVCLPSKELFRICWECEKVLRRKGSIDKLRCLVLRRLAPRLPWKRRRHYHRGHDIHLARAVIAKYIPLRIKAPFSLKEKKRLIKMFRYSSSMAKDELFDDIDGLLDGTLSSEYDSDELY